MDAEVQSIMDEAFKVPSFIVLWPAIHRHYGELGFTDPITDAERIEEYTWIVQQLRKFISTKSGPISEKAEKPVEMLAVLQKIKTAADGKDTAVYDRKHLVFQLMRDDWIATFVTNLSLKIEEDREKQENKYGY